MDNETKISHISDIFLYRLYSLRKYRKTKNIFKILKKPDELIS